MAKKEKEPEKDPAEPAETPKKKRPLLIIAVAGLAALAAIAAGVFLLVFSTPSQEKLAAQIARDENFPAGGRAAETGVGVMMELEPFVVNLADPKARHFLKASITLELAGSKAKEDADRMLPMIRNDIIMLLSSQTMEDIITMEGKIRLRDEIMARVIRIVGEGRLRNIYFAQFVVQ